MKNRYQTTLNPHTKWITHAQTIVNNRQSVINCHSWKGNHDCSYFNSIFWFFFFYSKDLL